MTTQKEIARILDRAAMRADDRGASSKQCWFLGGLMAAAGEDGSDYLLTALPLSKREASEMIEFFLGQQKAAA